MTVPSAYAITIYVNQVDVTSYAPYDKLKFEDYRRQPSNFSITLEDPSFVPEKDMTVFIFNPDLTGNPTLFSGYVANVKEVKRDNGIVSDYELDCADRKIRLQKTVVPYDSYTGLDTDILDNLLANAFPDLSDLYDFTGAVNLASGLDLPVNDDNLLDLLDKLSDQAGADWSFSRGAANQVISFTDARDAIKNITNYPSAPVWWQYGDSIGFVNGMVRGSGNPGNCFGWTATSISTAVPDQVTITIDFGGTFTVSNVKFDVQFDFNGSSLNVTKNGGGGTYNTATSIAWKSVDWNVDMAGAGLPFSASFLTLTFKNNSNAAGTLYINLDNIEVVTTEPFARDAAPDELNWDSTPPASAFDLNVSSSNEYAKNIDLDIGGWDDYNAVIVTGGSELVAKDWTYHGNVYQEHYPLETQIKDIVVYRNSGSDASPTWGSALLLGKWGVDDLLDDGGTKEVLYDEANHWLIFDSTKIPATLNRAFRVTGSIKKPIRVLVGDYPTGAVVYATTIYDANATTPEAAANIGFGFLNDQNAIRRLNFETMHPGLKVGQAISVTDTARGLSEVDTVIQKITTTWIGASGHANFEVECGIDESNDASSFIAENDKRSRDKAVPVPIGTTTFEKLYASDGSILYNSDGSMMFQRV